MRAGANHAGNKQYILNSFAHKFRPIVVEVQYRVNDNVVSRSSHYRREGMKNEYDQAKELWIRVMVEQQRDRKRLKIMETYWSTVMGYSDIHVRNVLLCSPEQGPC